MAACVPAYVLPAFCPHIVPQRRTPQISHRPCSCPSAYVQPNPVSTLSPPSSSSGPPLRDPSRKKRQLSRKSLFSEPVDPDGKVFCVCMGGSLDLELIGQTNFDGRCPLKVTKMFEEVAFAKVAGCDVFLFRFGCLVSWGLSKSQWEELKEGLAQYVFQPGPSGELEEDLMFFKIVEGPDAAPKLRRDCFFLVTSNTFEKLAYSYALAQSTKLTVYETLVASSIERTKRVPESLAKDGTTWMSRRHVARQLGQLFIIRSSVNLQTDILDLPEILWEFDEWDSLYSRGREYLGVSERAEILNQRLDVIRDLYEILQDELEVQQSHKEGIVIIILIAVELCVEILTELVDIGELAGSLPGAVRALPGLGLLRSALSWVPSPLRWTIAGAAAAVALGAPLASVLGSVGQKMQSARELESAISMAGGSGRNPGGESSSSLEETGWGSGETAASRVKAARSSSTVETETSDEYGRDEAKGGLRGKGPSSESVAGGSAAASLDEDESVEGESPRREKRLPKDPRMRGISPLPDFPSSWQVLKQRQSLQQQGGKGGKGGRGGAAGRAGRGLVSRVLSAATSLIPFRKKRRPDQAAAAVWDQGHVYRAAALESMTGRVRRAARPPSSTKGSVWEEGGGSSDVPKRQASSSSKKGQELEGYGGKYGGEGGSSDLRVTAPADSGSTSAASTGKSVDASPSSSSPSVPSQVSPPPSPAPSRAFVPEGLPKTPTATGTQKRSASLQTHKTGTLGAGSRKRLDALKSKGRKAAMRSVGAEPTGEVAGKFTLPVRDQQKGVPGPLPFPSPASSASHRMGNGRGDQGMVPAWGGWGGQSWDPQQQQQYSNQAMMMASMYAAMVYQQQWLQWQRQQQQQLLRQQEQQREGVSIGTPGMLEGPGKREYSDSIQHTEPVEDHLSERRKSAQRDEGEEGGKLSGEDAEGTVGGSLRLEEKEKKSPSVQSVDEQGGSGEGIVGRLEGDLVSELREERGQSRGIREMEGGDDEQAGMRKAEEGSESGGRLEQTRVGGGAGRGVGHVSPPGPSLGIVQQQQGQRAGRWISSPASSLFPPLPALLPSLSPFRPQRDEEESKPGEASVGPLRREMAAPGMNPVFFVLRMEENERPSFNPIPEERPEGGDFVPGRWRDGGESPDKGGGGGGEKGGDVMSVPSSDKPRRSSVSESGDRLSDGFDFDDDDDDEEDEDEVEELFGPEEAELLGFFDESDETVMFNSKRSKGKRRT
uniref:DUF155 domain-containing protein n=1 Tax=Chromera velia CCMP2878 TaxID=1169474 RepID=A0A0G4H061_9ALVE|eukprot:Cvel_24053.t1-p1 / transcript=Cvel_24053.t1 / gene=Cvel_24053 / organism=Chromera_velia_CCMP2878 / gene_product=Sporulation protein RMD1, putative / transcript_product=Sporulation protein RMD1, putative / location=Cvel_scaffold2558:4402-13779(-) / protein_length=1226 / sequence_SO=supercontig / SO=protein_coding / is_pseudo=false